MPTLNPVEVQQHMPLPVHFKDQKTSLGRHGSRLTIWSEPKEGGQYVAGADVSTGRAESASCAYVADLATGEIVACLWGYWPVTVYADKLYDLVIRYNRAFLGVERNMGETVLVRLIDAWAYENLYFDHALWGHADSAATPGLFMTEPIKRHALSCLHDDLMTGALIMPDPAFFQEAATFQVHQTQHGSERMRALRHRRDDRIMAAAILALMMRERAYEKPKQVAEKIHPDIWHNQRLREHMHMMQRLRTLPERHGLPIGLFTHEPEDEVLKRFLRGTSP